MKNKLLLKVEKRIVRLLVNYRIRKNYLLEYKKFKKYYILREYSNDFENIEALITLYYHTLEKGFSYINFRPGFGKKNIVKLLSLLSRYSDLGFDIDNVAYQAAINNLYKYIKVNEEHGIDTDYISVFLKKQSNNRDSSIGGTIEISKNDYLKHTNDTFDSFSQGRVSIRDFGDQKVSVDDLNNVFKLASKTPSVCNRQPWFTYLVLDESLIKEVLVHQNGFKGYGKNISGLLIVTYNSKFMLQQEFYQGYVDAGMYSMSLMHAMDFYQIANCPLNINMPRKNEIAIRELLDIKEYHTPVVILAFGSIPDLIITPKSSRYPIEQVTKTIK